MASGTDRQYHWGISRWGCCHSVVNFCDWASNCCLCVVFGKSCPR